MGLSKDKLIYDSTTPADGDSVASFLRTASGALTATGAAGALDVNITNALAIAVDLNGVYDGVSNLLPDSAGIIGHTRAASPALTGQVQRLTAGTASSDGVVAANVNGLDVNSFMMGYNGATWDRILSTNGAMNVAPLGNVADDAVDSGNPVKVGQRAVSGALVAVSASGDRADQISDLYRRTWVNTSPNIAASNAAIAIDTTAGGTVLVASVLAGRRSVEIQNLGTKAIFIGTGTVTAVNGFRIAAGATYTRELGPDIALKAISDSGTQDVRILQVA